MEERKKSRKLIEEKGAPDQNIVCIQGPRETSLILLKSRVNNYSIDKAINMMPPPPSRAGPLSHKTQTSTSWRKKFN